MLANALMLHWALLAAYFEREADPYDSVHLRCLSPYHCDRLDRRTASAHAKKKGLTYFENIVLNFESLSSYYLDFVLHDFENCDVWAFYGLLLDSFGHHRLSCEKLSRSVFFRALEFKLLFVCIFFLCVFEGSLLAF